MLNLFSHQGNTNRNQRDISSHPIQTGYYQKQKIINIGEDVEKKGLSYIFDENVNPYNHHGK